MNRYLAILAALTLSGCQTYTYKYNSLTYSTPEAALYAQRKALDEVVAAVPKASLHIGGTIVIVIPTRDVFREKGVNIRGQMPEEQVQYTVDGLEASYNARAAAVNAGQIFDQTKVVRVQDPGSYPSSGYTFKLALIATGFPPNTSWQWLLSETGFPGTQPVDSSPGVPAGAQREASFNEAIIRAAKLLRYEGGRSPQ